MRLALLVSLAALQTFAVETWVAAGYGGRRMISHDGLKWEITEEWGVDGKDDSNNLISAAYGAGKFVVVGGGGWSRDTQAGHILTSPDGVKWTEVKKLPFRVSPLVYAGKRFLAGGPDRTLWFSDDGTNWTQGGQAKADHDQGRQSRAQAANQTFKRPAIAGRDEAGKRTFDACRFEMLLRVETGEEVELHRAPGAAIR